MVRRATDWIDTMVDGLEKSLVRSAFRRAKVGGLRRPRDFKRFYLHVMTVRFPHQVVDYPYHLQDMIDVLLGFSGDSVVVSVPRRHSKTTTIIACFAYICLTELNQKLLYGTYSDDLASLAGKEFDAMIEAWGGPSKNGTANQKRVRGNVVFFSSLKGSVVGKGANRVIAIDDPVKNLEAAMSGKELDNLFANIESAVFSGAENKQVNKVVCGTRWSIDDPQGRLIARGWRYIHYKAISDDGNALWPSVRPLEYLLKLREEVGGDKSYTWQSLYQGNPPPETIRIFSSERIQRLPSDWASQITASSAGIDLAYSQASSADYKCLAVVHLLSTGQIAIEECILTRDNTPEFFSMVNARTELPCYWYTNSAEADRAFELEAVYGVDVRPLPSHGKLGNAQNFCRLWNMGDVFIPDSWTVSDGSPLQQIIRFTGKDGEHDDAVDAISAAIDDLTGRGDASAKDALWL